MGSSYWIPLCSELNGGLCPSTQLLSVRHLQGALELSEEFGLRFRHVVQGMTKWSDMVVGHRDPLVQCSQASFKVALDTQGCILELRQYFVIPNSKKFQLDLKSVTFS